jgi:hypothetical protein
MYHKQSFSHTPIAVSQRQLFSCAIFAFRQENETAQFAVQAASIISVNESTAQAEAFGLAEQVWPPVEGWERHGAVVQQIGNFREFLPAFG